MPINEPTITATCDKCNKDSEAMGLCSLAMRGCWGMHRIIKELDLMGWDLDDGKTICPDCVEDPDAA